MHFDLSSSDGDPGLVQDLPGDADLRVTGHREYFAALGLFREAAEVEKWLNAWLSNFVSEDVEADSPTRAKKPLVSSPMSPQSSQMQKVVPSRIVSVM